MIVNLVFSHLGFWSGNLFLIAPFLDLCLLVPFYCTCPLDEFSTVAICFKSYDIPIPILDSQNFIGCMQICITID